MSAAVKQTKSLSGSIFSTVLVFSLVILVVFGVVISSIFYESYEQDGEQKLSVLAQDAAEALNASEKDSNIDLLSEQFPGRMRYTLIDADGTVLYDSAKDASTMENHGSRPEVLAAGNGGVAHLTRYSETLKTDTIYAAVRLNDGGVVRLSENRESLLAFLGRMTTPIFITIVVVAGLVFLLSRMLTNRIMKPIDALNLADPLQNEIYSEMTPLLRRVDEQQTLLRRQNEELAEAENLRRDFSSNVSHEMKTPLQVISGYAELMQNGLVAPEDQKKFAGLIYEEAQAMRSLINDVLMLSRLDETAFDSEVATRIDVLEIAQREKMRLETFAQEQQVTVEVEGKEAFVAGTEALIGEMLHNLIENAIRYNHPDGKVWVSVSTEVVPNAFANVDTGMTPQQASLLRRAPGDTSMKAQNQVVLRVTDTGPGIPDEMKDKIFERFFRIDKSRSKETGGTGLGLAIVKHAVLYHNGTITVDSEMGIGTTFTVRLPEVE